MSHRSRPIAWRMRGREAEEALAKMANRDENAWPSDPASRIGALEQLLGP